MSYKETGREEGAFGGLMYKGREEGYMRCLTENRKREKKKGRAKVHETSRMSSLLFRNVTMFAFILVSRLRNSRDMRAAVKLGRCYSKTDKMEDAVSSISNCVWCLYGLYESSSGTSRSGDWRIGHKWELNSLQCEYGTKQADFV